MCKYNIHKAKWKGHNKSICSSSHTAGPCLTWSLEPSNQWLIFLEVKVQGSFVSNASIFPVMGPFKINLEYRYLCVLLRLPFLGYVDCKLWGAEERPVLRTGKQQAHFSFGSCSSPSPLSYLCAAMISVCKHYCYNSVLYHYNSVFQQTDSFPYPGHYGQSVTFSRWKLEAVLNEPVPCNQNNSDY